MQYESDYYRARSQTMLEVKQFARRQTMESFSTYEKVQFFSV